MKITIDGVNISNSRTYIIAEAGSNHNGDFSTAKQLIEAAAEAGADAVKFQAFKADTHYSKHTPKFSYLKEQFDDMSTYNLIKSLEINREWHDSLIKHAKSCGITFLSSPCDIQAIDQLASLGMSAFKVASFDITDLGLIQYIAQYCRPLILSTGMANYEDIQKAVNICKDKGNKQVILLQCTSLYPAPAEISNLLSIQTMKKAFGCPVGYSDHTIGDHIPIAAVAMGASVLEKHFTLDCMQNGPDHRFAMEPKDFAAMIKKIREVETAIGDGIKNGPHPLELEMWEKGRRSIHCSEALKTGDIITEDKICIKRPGYGIPPYNIKNIIGMRVNRDIPEDHWITWEDFKC